MKTQLNKEKVFSIWARFSIYIISEWNYTYLQTMRFCSRNTIWLRRYFLLYVATFLSVSKFSIYKIFILINLVYIIFYIYNLIFIIYNLIFILMIVRFCDWLMTFLRCHKLISESYLNLKILLLKTVLK